MSQVEVLFRMWTEKPQSCIALVVGVPCEHGHLVSYEPGVGPSPASILVYEEMTRPAEKSERKQLEANLRDIYGDFKIIQHLPRRAELAQTTWRKEGSKNRK